MDDRNYALEDLVSSLGQENESLKKELKECKEAERKVLSIVDMLSEELEQEGYDEMWTPQIKLTVIKQLLKGTK